MITESDWIKFKKIKEEALDRFCGTILDDVSEGLSNGENLTNHGKYLYLYKLIENYDKKIALLFNGHSRSKAILQLMMLRSEGLISDSDIKEISDELKEHTRPNKYA